MSSMISDTGERRRSERVISLSIFSTTYQRLDRPGHAAPLDRTRGVCGDGAEPSSSDYGNHPRARSTVFDAETVYARSDFVAALHFRVLGRQRIEVRAVAAAEVADADRAVGIGPYFEVAPGR